ncbi:MAG TPA: histidine--tRNA ligase [bacterium]|nr:histidine--tRNA ligase [bacterium]HOL34502.1 histidine--tRNA ligase [bacterium]
MEKQIKSVRGMRDILPDETRRWKALESLIFRVLESFGFEEIRVPIVEELKLFQRSVGSFTDIVQKEMYVFKDRGDRVLALRPEATACVVRAYLEHSLNEKKRITRLYYSGPMFRYDRPQKDRYRQFYQIGAEIIGGQNPYFDAELIIILAKIFEKIGVADYVFEINSVGCNQCKTSYSAKLKQFLQNRASHMCQDCQTRIENNVLRVLDCKVVSCKSIIKEAPVIQDILCQGCKAHQETLYRILDNHRVPYKENWQLVRGLDYYTKTVFELKISNNDNAVAGGGRYDNLVHELGGPETAACGFAIGMDRLCNMISPEIKKDITVFVVFLGEKSLQQGVKIVNGVRNDHVRIVADYTDRSLKSHLKSADREDIQHVLILGENELQQESFLYRNMKSGYQTMVKFSELSNFFKGLENA